MSEMTKNAIIYVRVSSERQVDGYSLDDQEERCKSEAERLGYTVLHVYREEGFSGKTMDRPELEELMNYCQLHHKNVQAFIFYHSSRLSRNTLNYLTLNAFFSKYGITTISVTEPITGDTPETNFLATILSATNQLDNEIKGRNVKNAMKRRFLEGHAIARVPLGYTFKASESTHKEVIRDDQWWEIISEMWRKLEYGFPLLSVSQWISSVSGKHINRSTVASMVTNRFNCGYLCSPTYGEIKGKHEPMISEETFYTVKQMLNGRRTSKTIQRKHNADFAVRGILRCPQGHMMTASWSKGRHKRYAYYFCSTCHSKGIPRNDVENAYTELLTEIVPTDATAKYFKELLTDEYNNQYQALTNTSEWIDKEIKHLNEQLNVLEEKHLDGVYTDEDYIRIRNGIKTRLVTQQSLLSEKKIDTLNIDVVINTLTYYLQHLDKLFMNANPETRYQMGGSITPKGFTFVDGKVRTAGLGDCYELIRNISTPMLNKYPTAE